MKANTEGYDGQLSPISVREQRIAKARRVFGLNNPKIDRVDQADQAAAEDHRTIDVNKVLQLLHHPEEMVVRKALQRFHFK